LFLRAKDRASQALEAAEDGNKGRTRRKAQE
jgi:hypothetical protein